MLIRPQLVMDCSQSSATTNKIITMVLINIFTPTRKRLEFKHASQLHGIRKYMKEDEDTYMAVAEGIYIYFDETQAFETRMNGVIMIIIL